MYTSIDRYILRQILVPTVLAFVVIGSLAISVEIQRESEDIPLGFLTPSDFVWLLLFILPSMIALLVPVSYFMGILMAYGRMAQQGEITAMQASGISLKRLTRSVLLTGMVLSIVSFALQEWLQPWGVNRAYELMYRELPQRATIDRLDAGELHEYGDWRIHFAEKNTETHTLYNFDLIQPEGDGVMLFHAEEAQLTLDGNQYVLRLKNGYMISEQNAHFRFDAMGKPFPTPDTFVMEELDEYEASLSSMLREERRITEARAKRADPGVGTTLRRVRRGIGERIADPFAAFAVALVGAPLGVQARRKGRTSLFSVGLGVMVVFYALKTVSDPSGLASLSEFIVRAWIPNLVLMTVGVVLLWRADRA